MQARALKLMGVNEDEATVNFINIKRALFPYERHFGSFFLRMYVCMYVKKAAEMTFVQKTRAFNVDEIDTWSLNKFKNCFILNFQIFHNKEVKN